MIITVKHLYSVPTWTNKVGYCAKGARFFFKKYNLDWQDFIKNGIDEELLIATNNALALHIVAYAKGTMDKNENELSKAVEELKNGR